MLVGSVFCDAVRVLLRVLVGVLFACLRCCGVAGGACFAMQGAGQGAVGLAQGVFSRWWQSHWRPRSSLS